MTAYSLLLVEDNPSDASLVKEYLTEDRINSYELFEAHSLRDALKLITHYDFDAVLLDLKLPDSAGLETVRRVITAAPSAAVIVLTGLQDEKSGTQAVRYGAQEFLHKMGLTPELLCKSLQHAIMRKRFMEEREDLLHDLHQALDKITLLEYLLPLCIGCKKIFCEDGRWYSLQEMPDRMTAGKQSETICPECKSHLDQEQ